MGLCICGGQILLPEAWWGPGAGSGLVSLPAFVLSWRVGWGWGQRLWWSPLPTGGEEKKVAHSEWYSCAPHDSVKRNRMVLWLQPYIIAGKVYIKMLLWNSGLWSCIQFLSLYVLWFLHRMYITLMKTIKCIALLYGSPLPASIR